MNALHAVLSFLWPWKPEPTRIDAYRAFSEAK